MAKKKMKLAARGRRFAAGCIDGVLPVVAYTVIMLVTGDKSGPGYNSYGYGYGYGYEYGYEYNANLSGASAVIVAVLGILMLAWLIAEFVFFAKSKSIGKAILGLQVVSSTDGKPLGFWKMVFRECIVKSASNVLALGYIWILIDDKNRGWHDKILDTYVVDLKESEKIAAWNAAAAAPAAPAVAPQTAPQTAPAPQPKSEEPAKPVSPEVVMPEAEPAAPAEPEAKPAEAVEAPAVEMPVAGPEAKPAETAEAPAVEMPAADIEVETVVEETPAEAAAETKSEAAKEVRVSMSMKKDELLAAAREAGVKVSSKATKQEIIDAVKKAAEK